MKELHLDDFHTNVLRPLVVFFDLLDKADLTGDTIEDDLPELGKVLCSNALTQLDKARIAIEAHLGGPVILDGTEGESFLEFRGISKAYVPKKHNSESEEILDFRTVDHESEDEAQLQRVHEVMLAGGKEKDLLYKFIDMMWNRCLEKETSEGKELETAADMAGGFGQNLRR